MHLSHSKRYWKAVASFEPNYRQLDRRLAESWRHLPAWVFALTHGDKAT
jgi:predicted metal-dependent hydrolase